jgi:hypothetical protein
MITDLNTGFVAISKKAAILKNEKIALEKQINELKIDLVVKG